MAEASSSTQAWGRVLFCGGTNWATNGRKDRPKDAGFLDVVGPTGLRSLCNIQAVKAITGPSANYAIVLDAFGAAYMIGAFPGKGYGSKGLIPDKDPVKITPALVGSTSPDAMFVAGACARSHCLLVDSDGEVWGCGVNVTGQLGMPVSINVDSFTRIPGPWTKDPEARIVAVSAGHTFSLFLTASGQVYAAGSSECGQLGNGRTGERLLKANKVAYDVETTPLLIASLQDRTIKRIASGSQHSLALDNQGHVYAWGNAGYSKLGLQDQEDRLTPTLVPQGSFPRERDHRARSDLRQFAGSNGRNTARAVYCGPTSSVVIDSYDKFYMAGKWKMTGDGGVGAPYTTFNCNVAIAALGGCTHFITSPTGKGDETMTAGFAQGALYGGTFCNRPLRGSADDTTELGLGPDSNLSCSKPTELTTLSGCSIVEIGAAAFFTLFIAKPNASYAELPMWPDEIDSFDGCIGCFENGSSGQDIVMCDKCEEGYHLECMDPPMEDVPEGEWFCPECSKEGTGGLDEPLRASPVWMKAKKPGWKERAQEQATTTEMRPPILTKSSKRNLIDDDRASVASNSSSRSKRSKA